MKRYVRTLAAIEDAEEIYGSLVTTASCTRRDVLRCVTAGLACDVGVVDVVDADENPSGRQAIGFVLTDAGHAYLERHRP